MKALREGHRRRCRAAASLAPKDLRGSAFGMLATVQSLGNFAASAIAGLLCTLVSPAAAFAYATACMIIALTAFTACCE